MEKTLDSMAWVYYLFSASIFIIPYRPKAIKIFQSINGMFGLSILSFYLRAIHIYQKTYSEKCAFYCGKVESKISAYGCSCYNKDYGAYSPVKDWAPRAPWGAFLMEFDWFSDDMMFNGSVMVMLLTIAFLLGLYLGNRSS